jgi:alcohol dehydrogenase (NADP+)
MELHPHFQQPELFDFVRATASSRWGTARSDRPDARSATARPEDTVDLEDPVIVEIARRLGVHPAVGRDPLGGAARPDAHSVFHQSAQLSANLEAAAGAPLSDEDMAAIAGIDRNCRLIKGQVFLWKQDQTGRISGISNGVITQ